MYEKLTQQNTQLKKMLYQFEFGLSLFHDELRQDNNKQACYVFLGNVAQCFTYTVAGLLGYFKTFLITLGFSPSGHTYKEIIRMSAFAKIITEPEAIGLIKMIEERNKTSHIYQEEIADAFAKYAPEALALIQTIVDRLEQKII